MLFSLDDTLFAVTARDVREVVFAARITPLPGAPDVVEGVLNVRGTLAPAFDLRKRFGLPARPLDPDEHIVVAMAGGRLVVFRTDRVRDFARIPDEAIDRTADLVEGAAHVAGVGRTSDGLVLIHDLTAFLSSSEVIALDDALTRTRSEAESE